MLPHASTSTPALPPPAIIIYHIKLVESAYTSSVSALGNTARRQNRQTAGKMIGTQATIRATRDSYHTSTRRHHTLIHTACVLYVPRQVLPCVQRPTDAVSTCNRDASKTYDNDMNSQRRERPRHSSAFRLTGACVVGTLSGFSDTVSRQQCFHCCTQPCARANAQEMFLLHLNCWESG